MQQLSVIGLALGVAFIFCLFHRLLSKRQVKYLQFAAACAIFLMLAWRTHLTDGFNEVYNGVLSNDKMTWIKNPDFLASFSRWALNFAICLIPIALTSNNKTLKKASYYLGIPCLIFVLSTFDNYIGYFTMIQGRGYQVSETYRIWQFTCELALLFGSAFYVFITDKDRFNLKKIHYLGIALPFLILLTVPMTVPQSLAGYGPVRFTAFSLIGVVGYSLMILAIIILYRLLRHRDPEVGWSVCRFLAFVMLVQYTATNRGQLSFSSLPLQLCNIGVYLTMIAFIFRWKGLFDMLMIVNLQGTIVALLVVNTVEKTGVLSFWQMHYLYEHILLFIIPVLATAIGLFKLVDRKSLKNAFIGFAIYYCFSIVAGTLINQMYPLEIKVDYFYVFRDVIVKSIPMTAYFRTIMVIDLGIHKFYPVFYFVIFIGYALFLLLTYRGIYYFRDVYLGQREINNIRKRMRREKKYAENN